ncbi:MAG: DUF444 family protein, partial [bacterium]|nr:DUF444 family protein [bacterium]
MAIIVSEPTTERGNKDAKRHRDKQREAIKKQLPEIFADESIITRRKGKTVKVPIKSIDIPRFRPARDKVPIGIGQGNGKRGDVIGEIPGDGTGKGKSKPGNQPSEGYIETEIEIEELIEMMLEDLGLPRLEEKEVQQIVVKNGWKIEGLRKIGPRVLMNNRATAKEGVKRFWFLLHAITEVAKVDELTAFRALKQAQGIMPDALEILRD